MKRRSFLISPFEIVLMVTLLGVIGFYILERLFAWYHCVEEKCEVHDTHVPGRQAVILTSAFVEEFIDGSVISLAVVLGRGSLWLAVTTSLVVFLHEFPDSIARSVAFVKSGATLTQAMRKVLLTTLGAFAGATLVVTFSATFVPVLPYLTALAAAAFIYIALSHLMPEQHRGT